MIHKNVLSTGKSLSEALLFAEHGESMLCAENVLNVKNNFCTQHVPKIRASDKDLPVLIRSTSNKATRIYKMK